MAMGLPCSGHTTAMAVQPNDPTAPLLVACLCAQWCGLCRDYAPLMKATLAQFDAAQLVVKWVDIEDHDEALGDLDIQNFPTLLIARGEAPLFFGTITPHAQTLQRLLQSALAGDMAPMPPDPGLGALVANLRSLDTEPM